MSAVNLTPGDHVAIVKPDSKSRFALGRWLSREPNAGWRAYRLDDGKTVVLEAIEETS
jgi:hypothetical protein